MKKEIGKVILSGMAWLLLLAAAACSMPQTAKGADAMREDFILSPFQYHSRPLWFWNGPLSAEKTAAMLDGCKSSGYYGVGILPAQGMTPAFMTPEFLDRYKEAVTKAGELGMKCCLYDEYWFPSGSAGGQLARQYPEALSKRLDMLAMDVTGPKHISQDVTSGVFMGAVAMHPDGSDRRDISANAREGKLAWDAPEGNWKVMSFVCVRDGARGLVDYLDPGAIARFIELTYQKYYDKFPEQFGRTIDCAFYDEPTFHWVQGGRAWTPAFNARFKEKRGFDPVIYYPALWFDIGPETAAARNALFGFRAELYSTGFPKVINDWCAAHGIKMTGHVDQEEVVNPVGLCGDLIKAFKYQSIPGIDQVFQYGRASKAYKVVSSAAYNHDRPVVMTECYGGIKDMPVANLCKEAMDQFAKGINLMVPHAVWYNSAKIIFQPELSHVSSVYGLRLPEYNQYIGRLQRLLQGGRHVADIGVLYPIATLQGGYYFGVGKPYEGGVIPKEADYMEIGEMLSLQARRDYTFIHPETLDEKCSVSGAEIHLDNKTNAERYSVFVVPGSKTIAWSNLKKIKEFYDNGGKVIATTQLSDTSAEFGKDAEVRQAIKAMFGGGAVGGGDGGAADHSRDFPKVSASSVWEQGGFDPQNAVDGDRESRWNTAAKSGGAQWLEADFGQAKSFCQTVIYESFDRVTAYRIQYWDGGKWVDCAKGERIGKEKKDTFPPVTASRIRLCLDAINGDCLSLNEFEVLDAQNKNLLGNSSSGKSAFVKRENEKGGKAYFIARPNGEVLRVALDDAFAVCDVRLDDAIRVKGGNLSYIHKVVEGRSVYFFGNSSETQVDTVVRLRGNFRPEAWDPHTGRIAAAECSHQTEKNQEVTLVPLSLAPVHSLFIVTAETTSGKQQ